MTSAAVLGDSVVLYVGVADAGTGVERINATFGSAEYYQLGACQRSQWLEGTPAYGVMRCAFGPPGVIGTGTWTLLEVVITDRTGNARPVFTGELQALGYPTTVVVTP